MSKLRFRIVADCERAIGKVSPETFLTNSADTVRGRIGAKTVTLLELPEDMWSENARYPREEWKRAVVNGDTNNGYWEWVADRLRDLDASELS